MFEIKRSGKYAFGIELAKRSWVIPLFLLLQGCVSAPESTSNSVPQPWPEELCVIESPTVREGFINTLIPALQQKGLQTKMIEKDSSLDACTWTLTYGARWQWDLALYMATAQLAVYRDNWPVGEIYYHGGYGLSKFVDAEAKIIELVDQLFPKENL